MLKYLLECFSNEITSSIYAFPKGTPVYMKDSYTLEKYNWQDESFILITPKDNLTRLPTLKKHFYQIEEKIKIPCALNLEWLTPRQRNNLINSKIPFVSGENQIYLPFWGCVFKNKYKNKISLPKKMSPSTQLIFLWAYYAKKNNEKINLSIASLKLHLSTTSVSRSFLELVEYGLVKQVQEKTIKWIEFTDNLSNILNISLPYLNSPIKKYIYLKEIPTSITYKIGGIRALSTINTNDRDGSFVIDKNTFNLIPKDYLLNKRDFNDFGGKTVEVWKYNPMLLSSNKKVDDISLLLSLMDNDDERIQKELDKIKARNGIKI